MYVCMQKISCGVRLQIDSTGPGCVWQCSWWCTHSWGWHSIEVCVERERAAAVGTQEQTTLVIVVGMEIVPEDWRSTEYRGHIFDGGERYRLGDDLWTYTGVRVEQFRVFLSPQTIHVTVCMYNTHHSMYVQYTSQYVCMYSTYAGVAPGEVSAALWKTVKILHNSVHTCTYKSHNYAVLSV